jgi:hypothetical protein
MKQPKVKPQMYVLRKNVKANSASHAIRLDKVTPVRDAYLDEHWKEQHLADAIGFHELEDIEEDEEE